MTEDFVTYEQAELLKELGFNQLTIHHYDVETHEFSPKFSHYYTICYDNWNQYNNTISAPTLSQVQKWLREVKEIYLFVTMEDLRYYWYIGKEFQIDNSKSYEEALSAGIDRALEIIKNNI